MMTFSILTNLPFRKGKRPVSLARVFAGEELLCDLFDGCLRVSRYLLAQSVIWLNE